MFAAVRSLRPLRGFRPRPGRDRPRRRRRIADRLKRFETPLLVLGGIAGIATAAWIVAGGDPSSVWPWTDHSAAADLANPAGGVPVHLDSVLLRTLLELRQEWWAAGNQDEPLFVVATRGPASGDSRTAAWRSLLQHSTRGSGEPPLRALVLVVPDVTLRAGADGTTSRWAAPVV